MRELTGYKGEVRNGPERLETSGTLWLISGSLKGSWDTRFRWIFVKACIKPSTDIGVRSLSFFH